MRRSSVALLLLCAMSPLHAAAEPFDSIEVVSPGTGVDVRSVEGTAIQADAYHIGLDAAGQVYGARLAGGLQLVPETGGIVGVGYGPPEAGTLYVGADGTLWYRVVSATETDPGNVIALSRQGPPAGSISAYAGTTAPTGYLFCNGQAVSRTAYAALFSAIGIAYGAGDGSTTFNVPDLRGQFVRGLDNGRGVDAGRTVGSSQLDAFQGHRHSPLSGGFVGTGAGNNWVGGWGSFSAQVTTGNPTTDGSNGTPRTASETRPVNVAMNFIIAY